MHLKSFYNFARLNSCEQRLILLNMGTLVDTDTEEENICNLYFLNGFFVEERISIADGRLCEILPFRQGYKLASFMKFASDFSSN